MPDGDPRQRGSEVLLVCSPYFNSQPCKSAIAVARIYFREPEKKGVKSFVSSVKYVK
ncbi:hypothetical protein J6590_070778 [Homalodisca vitripennis]|nr:hypothetical protein J6590_070778 [Homalodisca vitripennis]